MLALSSGYIVFKPCVKNVETGVKKTTHFFSRLVTFSDVKEELKLWEFEKSILPEKEEVRKA